MKSNLSTLAIDLVPVLLFAVAIFLLINPWAYSLLLQYDQISAIPFLAPWALVTLAASAYFGRWLAERREALRKYFLSGFLGLNLLVLFLLNWPLAILAPFSLLLVLCGFRFRLYSTTADVRTDIVIGVILIFFNLAVSTVIPYTVGIADVIVFFLAIGSLTAFLNLRDLKQEGFAPRYSLSFLLLLLLGGVVVLAAFAVGVPLEGRAVQSFVGLVQRAYLLVSNLFVLILYPLIWILRPLFGLIEGLEFEEPEPLERPDPLNGGLEELQEGIAEPGAAGGPPVLTYIAWGFVCFVLLVALILVVRKLSSREEEHTEKGVSEESESVFSLSRMGQGSRQRWSELKDKLSKFLILGGAGRYQGSDPITVIRGTYYRFVLAAGEFVAFREASTPRDFLARMQERGKFSEIEDELRQLTELYNRARYGREADREAARRARNLWENIEKVLNSTPN